MTQKISDTTKRFCCPVMTTIPMILVIIDYRTFPRKPELVPMSNHKVRFASPTLANASTPDPNQNIPPDPNEGEFRWDEGFLKADHISLRKPSIKRYEILVPYTVASTVQTAVKKTVAILLAHSTISIIPHVEETSRNSVQHEKDFPIEAVAMKDYIFDVGKVYHNGVAHFKASFLVESIENLTKIKKNGAIDKLKAKRIYVQEFVSNEVFDSREVGFLCNLHPVFTAKEKVISELKAYVRDVTGENVKMKLKLTNRYFGNSREGSVKSQYLSLCIETTYCKQVGQIIGNGLEKNRVLQRWKNIKLLPTRPTLHASYNKEKFLQVLQIHNKSIRETTRVAIKNMWVGDYNMWLNEELTAALDLPHKKYTFRQMLLKTADKQNVDILDFYVSGSQAFVVCKTNDYTKTCDFVDIFLEICKEKYGEEDFAKQMRCTDPSDPKRHPTRVTRPVYTSQKGVDDMIRKIGPGVRLMKVPNNIARPFTSHKNERPWNQVLITTSKTDTNTSPLTNDTNSKIKNLYEEVSQLRRTMDENMKKNKDKIDMITDTVEELKEGMKISIVQQEKMNQTVMEAINLMQKQMAEITATQAKLQTMFLKMSGVYTPLKISQSTRPYTQLRTHEMTNEDSTDEDSMDFSMTNLKRSREDRILAIDLQPTKNKRNDKEMDLIDTPEKEDLKHTPKHLMSDPPERQRKGHAQP